MSKVRDAWYVRLPNGQEITAKSSDAVIHHILHGNIPKASRARRSRSDEWVLLEWLNEFNEVVTGVPRPHDDAPAPNGPKPVHPPHSAPTGLATRLDPMLLRTVGVRGLWDDLIGALDSTFVPNKLAVAVFAGGLIGLLWGGVPWLGLEIFALFDITFSGEELAFWQRLLTRAAAVPAIIVLALTNGLLARMTHRELSSMRAAGARAALRGYLTPGIRLLLAYLILLGGALLLVIAARLAPSAIYDESLKMEIHPRLAAVLPAIVSAAGLLGEVFLWLIVGLTWLLAPVLVAEDYPLFGGLAEWGGLLRRHFNRILLSEALTLALGVLLSVPIVVPVIYAAGEYPLLPVPLRTLAIGLAAGGFIGFMAVANVFIYLDVKYEQN